MVVHDHFRCSVTHFNLAKEILLLSDLKKGSFEKVHPAEIDGKTP